MEFSPCFTKSIVNGIRVRVAEMDDAEAITAVINTAFRKAEAFLIDRDRIDLNSVQQFLQTGKFLLAEAPRNKVPLTKEELDGKTQRQPPLGCVYVEQHGDRAYLGMLSVGPDRQKAGLGSALMKSAEEYCAKSGAQYVDLQIINLREELPRFYHRLGYVETGTAPLTPNIKPKQPCHFIKMSKPLTLNEG